MQDDINPVPGTSGNRDVMLYVNIPFCRAKCTFCDHVQPIHPSDLTLAERHPMRVQYMEALCQEFEHTSGQQTRAGREPCAVYWGGGTATILGEREIQQVAESMWMCFGRSNLEEATIEGSPDTMTPSKLSLFAQLGFNRVSIGAQSFDENRLKKLARLHSPVEVEQAVVNARAAGFANVNIDIMCGFPDETNEEVLLTVYGATRLRPEHISLYPFRMTPGTGLRSMIDRDKVRLYLERQKRSFAMAVAILHDHGYRQYASGYFGKPSRFTTGYFQLRGDMLGFGAGAMSIINQRFKCHTNGKLREYLKAPCSHDVDLPATADPVVLASLRAGLSHLEGIPVDSWRATIGRPLSEAISQPGVAPLTKYLRANGLIEGERSIRLPPERLSNILMDINFQLLTQATERPVAKQ